VLPPLTETIGSVWTEANIGPGGPPLVLALFVMPGGYVTILECTKHVKFETDEAAKLSVKVSHEESGVNVGRY
jgi:hypothetical protein